MLVWIPFVEDLRHCPLGPYCDPPAPAIAFTRRCLALTGVRTRVCWSPPFGTLLVTLARTAVVSALTNSWGVGLQKPLEREKKGVFLRLVSMDRRWAERQKYFERVERINVGYNIQRDNGQREVRDRWSRRYRSWSLGMRRIRYSQRLLAQ